MATPTTAQIMDTLGLSEEELCEVVATDPLTLISGEAELLPTVTTLWSILLAALDQVSSETLKVWLRARSGGRSPLDLLLGREFAEFELRLEELINRGFTLSNQKK